MRGFLTLFSVFALASTSVFASPVARCTDELCGGIGFPNGSPGLTDIAASLATSETPTRSIPERGAEEMTNAERFVRGLPPKRPKNLQGSRIRRTQPSALPLTTLRGIVRIDRADNGGTLGYLSASSINGAQYRYQSRDNALIVNFKFDPAKVSGPVSDFTAENSDTGFPAVGLVQGRDNINSNIASGSYQFLYISGTTPTSPGATPQNVPNAYTSSTGTNRSAESEVWSYNGVTNALTLQWVNTDGSKPTMKLFTQSTALYAGGDQAAFSARYPSPVVPVTYTFIPL